MERLTHRMRRNGGRIGTLLDVAAEIYEKWRRRSRRLAAQHLGGDKAALTRQGHAGGRAPRVPHGLHRGAARFDDAQPLRCWPSMPASEQDTFACFRARHQDRRADRASAGRKRAPAQPMNRANAAQRRSRQGNPAGWDSGRADRTAYAGRKRPKAFRVGHCSVGALAQSEAGGNTLRR